MQLRHTVFLHPFHSKHVAFVKLSIWVCLGYASDGGRTCDQMGIREAAIIAAILHDDWRLHMFLSFRKS